MASKRSLTSAARPASHVRAATMKAIVQHRYGAPDVLAFEEIERPRAGDQDVLIRVHPAGVSYPDGGDRQRDPLHPAPGRRPEPAQDTASGGPR